MDGFPRRVSKAEMIEAAREAGLGQDLNLDRVFVDWQSIGLLGRPDTRAPRRGGEGLWHPNQLYLWLNLLHFRTRLKRRVPTLANLPVAAWRLSEEGVATEQAQRAYRFWDSMLDNTQRPKGDRSLRRQAIDERIEWIAAADAPRTAKLRLRELIERINDTAPKITVSPDTLASAVLGVLAPGRDPTDIEKMFARSNYDAVHLQAIAHRYRHHLLASTSATLKFWEWARRLDQIEMKQELALRPRLAQDPNVGRFYQPFTADEFTTGSCMRMMTIFGIGLRRLLDASSYWPEASEEPPPLRGLTKTSE
jgi:hypothetical protein